MPPCVYLLQNERGRTYVGATTQPVERRVRQHNGELSGGANQTTGGRPWSVECTIHGFRSYQECLQFEYAWRRVHRRLRPRPLYTVIGRRQALLALMAKSRWSRNSPPAAEVPLRVEWRHPVEAVDPTRC